MKSASRLGDSAVRWPVFLASIWLLIGLDWALLAPRLALAPMVVLALGNTVPLLLTASLIVWNLIASIRLFARTGNVYTALPLTLVQIGLFGLLFFQIACHLGADHYRWEQTPRWWDWLALIGIHTIRAADILDMFQAFGVNVQVISHNSYLTAACLIAFHVIVDLFLLKVFVDGVEMARQGLLKEFRILPVVFVVAFLAAWLTTALAIRPWRPRDLLVWPVDNFLRVIDVADVMDIFHVRLHQVAATPWEGLLTIWCRIIFAGLMAGLLGWASMTISLRLFGGLGLGRDELRKISRKHPEREYRRIARQRLDNLEQHATGGNNGRASTLERAGFGVALTGGIVALIAVLVLAPWGRAVDLMKETALGSDTSRSVRALDGLRRMGSYAAAAVPTLTAGLASASEESRQAIVQTLGHLGPDATAPLGEMLAGKDVQRAEQALRALRRVGPAAAPVLADAAAKAPHPAIRESATQAVLELGVDGVQYLVDNIESKGSLVQLQPVLGQLDPYWYYRSSRNKVFTMVAIGIQKHLPSLSRYVKVLDNPRATTEEKNEALTNLGKCGGPGKDALPHLIKCLDDLALAEKAAEACGELAPTAAAAIPALQKLLLPWRDRTAMARSVGRQITDRDKQPFLAAKAAMKALIHIDVSAIDPAAGGNILFLFITSHLALEWDQGANSYRVRSEFVAEAKELFQCRPAIARASPALGKWLFIPKNAPPTEVQRWAPLRELATAMLDSLGSDAAPFLIEEVNAGFPQDLNVAWILAAMDHLGPLAINALPVLEKALASEKLSTDDKRLMEQVVSKMTTAKQRRDFEKYYDGGRPAGQK